MNLLAHLWLAERTGTSAAGQILGDLVKGRLDEPRFGAFVDHGIRLHRRIDTLSDDHPAHRALRRRFQAPLRRYAGILTDIGFDHALALGWARYHHEPLDIFARRAEQRVIDEWPAGAPHAAARMRGLAAVLADNANATGVRRALISVSRRLKHANPVAQATSEVVDLEPAFSDALATLLADLEAGLRAFARKDRQSADRSGG